MLDLEAIKARRVAFDNTSWRAEFLYAGQREVVIAFIAHAPTDIDALVAEVERLQGDITGACLTEIALDSKLEKAIELIKSVEWIYKSAGGSGALCCAFCRELYPSHTLDCERQAMLDSYLLQPCGHPRSAIATDSSTHWCTMCEAEARKEQDE